MHNSYRPVESVESGLGQSIREGDESRISRYTISRDKQVKWEELSHHSDRSEVVEERKSKREKKKKRSRRKGDITVGKFSVKLFENVVKLKCVRGVEWVHGLFLFPLVLGKI